MKKFNSKKWMETTGLFNNLLTDKLTEGEMNMIRGGDEDDNDDKGIPPITIPK